MPTPFNPLDAKLLYRLPTRMQKKSSWNEHIPVAMFLVEILQPRVIVELGTQRGVSYCAFCQAVEELKLSTRCYAVDTWMGDAHAGWYKESVFRDLQEFHRRYEPFSTLLRMTFAEALPRIPDSSVDLLHVDGLHFYEAVKKDYDSWLPKVSERGVIILHDTVEMARDFGVHQLWAELSPKFPSFNFEHGHGLGVLAVGPQVPAGMMEFLRAANEKPEATRALFSALGRRMFLEIEKDWLARQPPLGRALAALRHKV